MAPAAELPVLRVAVADAHQAAILVRCDVGAMHRKDIEADHVARLGRHRHRDVHSGLACAGGNPWAPVTLAQDAAGDATFRRRLQATGVAPEATRVVMEATSTYWIALAVALHEAGCQVSVINPAQAHSFAKHPRAGTRLRRAKTDALDAPGTRGGAGATGEQTGADALVAAPSGLPRAAPTPARERSAAVEQELRLVLANGAWADSAALLTSAPGIGVLTAAWLLATTVNVTLAPGAEALTAYAGLAPMPRQSGTSVHGRPSIGHAGNGHLRRALYMATLSAARWVPYLSCWCCCGLGRGLRVPAVRPLPGDRPSLNTARRDGHERDVPRALG